MKKVGVTPRAPLRRALSTSSRTRAFASANAAFVFCYALGMLAGPQAIGIGMDLMGSNGFGITLAVFFIGYLMLAVQRFKARK